MIENRQNRNIVTCIVWWEIPEFVIVLIYSHGNVVTIIVILFPCEKVEDHRKPGFTLREVQRECTYWNSANLSYLFIIIIAYSSTTILSTCMQIKQHQCIHPSHHFFSSQLHQHINKSLVEPLNQPICLRMVSCLYSVLYASSLKQMLVNL